MQNSNEKSKECCHKCDISLSGLPPCCNNNRNCKCHKPSVEVSKCCGSRNTFGMCFACGKPFEPQSIPLDRDEREKVIINDNEITQECKDNQAWANLHGNITLPPQTESEESDCCGASLIQLDGKLYCRACRSEYKPDLTPNLTPESTEMEEWEKSFDKIQNYGQVNGESNEENNWLNKYEVKQFISNLLSSHSQKLVSKLKSKIEGLPAYTSCSDKTMGKVSDEAKVPKYGQNYLGREDVLNIINNIK